MKKFAAIIFAMMLCCSCLQAFALQNSDVVGKWVSVSMQEGDIIYSAQGDLTIELKKDGTLIFPDEDLGMEYTWKIDGDLIYLFDADGYQSEVILSMSGSQLLMDDGMYCFIMEKKAN